MGGHTPLGALPRLPNDVTPGSRALRGSMQVPFPYIRIQKITRGYLKKQTNKHWSYTYTHTT